MTTRVPAQMRGLSPITGNNALQINAAIDALAAAGTNIIVQRVDGSNFTAAANTTAVYGQITFEIQ